MVIPSRLELRWNGQSTKMLWACDSFLNGLEPTIYPKTINTYAYQLMTEELPDELIEQISPIRGAYSDIVQLLITTE